MSDGGARALSFYGFLTTRIEDLALAVRLAIGPAGIPPTKDGQ